MMGSAKPNIRQKGQLRPQKNPGRRKWQENMPERHKPKPNRKEEAQRNGMVGKTYNPKEIRNPRCGKGWGVTILNVSRAGK